MCQICFAVPNDCQLVHYGHDEVMKAITNTEPKYKEVIQSPPQPPPNQQQPPQPVPGTSAPVEPGQEPAVPSFQAGKQGWVPQDPSKTLPGKVDTESIKAGFPDMWETQKVKEYLILNRNYRLVPVSTALMHRDLSDFVDSILCLHQYCISNFFSLFRWLAIIGACTPL